MNYINRARNDPFFWVMRLVVLGFGLALAMFGIYNLNVYLPYNTAVQGDIFKFSWFLVMLGGLAIIAAAGVFMMLVALLASICGYFKYMRVRRAPLVGVRMPKKRPAHLRVVRDGSTKPWIPPMDYLDRRV